MRLLSSPRQCPLLRHPRTKFAAAAALPASLDLLMDPPEKPPPAAASTASPSRCSGLAPMSSASPPRATTHLLRPQRPGNKPSPDFVAATWEWDWEVGGTSTSTTTREMNFSEDSVRAMENKSCAETAGPVRLTFDVLKKITNNFADKLGCGASAEVYKVPPSLYQHPLPQIMYRLL